MLKEIVQTINRTVRALVNRTTHTNVMTIDKDKDKDRAREEEVISQADSTKQHLRQATINILSTSSPETHTAAVRRNHINKVDHHTSKALLEAQVVISNGNLNVVASKVNEVAANHNNRAAAVINDSTPTPVNNNRDSTTTCQTKLQEMLHHATEAATVVTKEKLITEFITF